MFSANYRKILGLTLLCSFLFSGNLFAVHNPLEEDLKKLTDNFIGSKGLGDQQVALYLTELKGDKVLFAHNAEKLLVPASLNKLVSSAAALKALGPDYRFKTEFYTNGQFSNGQLVGDLIVKGYGDPSLTSEGMLRIAQKLRIFAANKITGDLILDSSSFAKNKIFAAGKSQRAFDAPLSALTVNYNSLNLFLFPTKIGQAARAVLDMPISLYRLENKVKTAKASKRLALKLVPRRKEGQVLLRASGKLAVNKKKKIIARRVLDPLANYGGQLLAAIENSGGQVGGKIRVAKVPATAKKLFTHYSRPLPEVLQLMNSYSNNLIAEQLLLVMALEKVDQAVTTRAAGKNLESVLRQFAVAKNNYHIVDGSGYSRNNRITAKALTQFIKQAANDPLWGPEYLAAMAIGGTKGTLRKREFNSSQFRLRGKSGYLKGVNGLAGVISSTAGKQLVFAVLINSKKIDFFTGRAFYDQLLAALEEHFANDKTKRE